MKSLKLALLCLIITATTKAQSITIDSLIKLKIDSALKSWRDTLQGTPNVTITRNGKIITADVSAAISGAPAVAKKASDDVAAWQKILDAIALRIKAIEDINAKLKAAY